MGASFLIHTLDGKLTPEKVMAEYKTMRSEAEYEDGNSYSGNWNMTNGLSIKNQCFESAEAAEQFLDENCQKWSNAIAVRYKATKQEATSEPTYGGKAAKASGMGCISSELEIYGSQTPFRLAMLDYSGDQNVIRLADQLTEAQKEKAKRLINAFLASCKQANETRTAFEGFVRRVNDLSITDFNDYFAMKSARNKAVLAKKEYLANLDALKAYNEERAPKLYSDKTVNLGERWMIGGVCAS